MSEPAPTGTPSASTSALRLAAASRRARCAVHGSRHDRADHGMTARAPRQIRTLSSAKPAAHRPAETPGRQRCWYSRLARAAASRPTAAVTDSSIAAASAGSIRAKQPRQRVDHAVERLVRHRLALVAAPGEDHARRRGRAARATKRRDQRALADARLALDEHRHRAAGARAPRSARRSTRELARRGRRTARRRGRARRRGARRRVGCRRRAARSTSAPSGAPRRVDAQQLDAQRVEIRRARPARASRGGGGSRAACAISTSQRRRRRTGSRPVSAS